jgi:predicted nucleic acid-binding protein
VEPQTTLEAVAGDPDGNRVLECAVAGGASYIVTGDAHLLDLGDYQGIVILKPRSFLSVLDLQGAERPQSPGT